MTLRSRATVGKTFPLLFGRQSRPAWGKMLGGNGDLAAPQAPPKGTLRLLCLGDEGAISGLKISSNRKKCAAGNGKVVYKESGFRSPESGARPPESGPGSPEPEPESGTRPPASRARPPGSGARPPESGPVRRKVVPDRRKVVPDPESGARPPQRRARPPESGARGPESGP
eukprot:gene12891-biopygen452